MGNNRKRAVANTALCGTPAFTGNGWNQTPSTWTEMLCLLKKIDVYNTRDRKNSDVGSFARKP